MGALTSSGNLEGQYAPGMIAVGGTRFLESDELAYGQDERGEALR